jgi:predicted transporter
MLKQLWVTGVLVAFSVFGIKVGLGLGAQVFNKAVSIWKRILIMGGGLFVYLVLFFCLYYVISNFNLLNYLDQLMNMMQYGMLLHLAVAVGLFIWGAN